MSAEKERRPSAALLRTGLPAAEDLAVARPSDERLARGALAVLECFQRIPCDPCASSCRRGAIAPFADINDLPSMLEADKCNGCALCVARCPGLAIFIIDLNHSPDEALIKLAYEFLPQPEKDQVVAALDREGREVGRARVIRVQKPRDKAETPVVWIAVPKDLAWTVRNIRVEGNHGAQ
ncbi:MAG: 4Fe-4S ferredoxin [Bacillota bacterium]